MKKALSILLILTMLLTMVVAAIPAGAVEDGDGDSSSTVSGVQEPTYDENTIGNKIITAENREEYKAELIAAGYIPIVNSAEKRTELIEAGFADVRNLGDKNVKLPNDMSFFLWEDIDYTAIRNWGQTNVVIDGAGHTINMTVESLYTKLNGVTLKNVTIAKATPTVLTSDATMPTVLARYNDVTSYVRLENVTIDVDYTYTSYPKQPLTSGVIVHKLNAGSRLENVLIDSTINVDLNSTGGIEGFTTFGAVAATASSSDVDNPVLLENVVSRGTLNITGKISHCKNVAGILGSADANVKLDRCFNEMDINVKHGAVLGTMSGEANVAGVVANVAAGAKVVNCVNSGDITFGDDANSSTTAQTKFKSVGGVVGIITGSDVIDADVNSETNTYALEGCYNKGNITICAYDWFDATKAPSEGVSGIAGKVNGSVGIKNCVNTANLTIKNGLQRALGGVAGYISGAASFVGCVNKGAVSTTKYVYAGVGGVAGTLNGGTSSATFTDCSNEGAVSITESTIKVVYGVGGILGNVEGATASFNGSSNSGSVKAAAQGDGTFGIGGILGKAGTDASTTTVIFDDCSNGAEIAGVTTDVSKDYHIGGIVGSIVNATADISGCVNDGVITGNVVAKISNVMGFGGIVGYVRGLKTNAGTTTLDITDCVNNATVTAQNHDHKPAGVVGIINYLADVEIVGCTNNGDVKNYVQWQQGYAGGIVCYYGEIGGASSSLVIRNCTNAAMVYSLRHSGGMLGYTATVNSTNSSIVIEGCVNSARVITTQSETNSANAWKFGSSGGMIGHLAVDGGTSTVRIQYCANANTATIYNTQGATYTYAGGMVAYVRGAGNISLIISDCANQVEGDSTVVFYKAGYAGGAIAGINAANAEVSISNFMNGANVGGVATGASNVNYAAGVIASCDAAKSVTISDCVNANVVNGNTLSAGIAGNLAAGYYDIDDCLVLGTITVNSAITGIAGTTVGASTIDGCVVAPVISFPATKAIPDVNVIAPSGYTVNNNSYMVVLPEGSESYEEYITDTYGSAELEDEVALEAAIEVLDPVAYDKANLESLYSTAAKIEDPSVFGDGAVEFAEAKEAAGAATVLKAGNEAYFTTQSNVDEAYDRLYDAIYAETESATFTVYIPDSIKVGVEQIMTADVENWSIFSSLAINVSGDFTLVRDGDDEAYITYYIEGENEATITDDATLLVIEGENPDLDYTFTAKVDEENSNAVVPGKYKGKLTFTIEYTQKTIDDLVS